MPQLFCMNALRRSRSLKNLVKITGLTFLIFLVSACTTQKRRGDTSKLKKFYHNTTAKYNGYFNANEILLESINQLNGSYRDNYNKLLELYPYVANNNAQSQASSLDEAIKKVSVVVNLHRISHWTDDCYLLLGQAQYLKQNYEDAQEAFEFLAAEYSPEAMAAREKADTKGKKKKKKPSSSTKKKKKKRKPSSSAKKKSSSSSKKKSSSSSYGGKKKKKKKSKKRRPSGYGSKKKKAPSKSKPKPKEEAKIKDTSPKETPKKVEKTTNTKTEKTEKTEKAASIKADEKAEKYFLKHRPVYQEGQLWLARTYTEREMYSEAEVILQKLDKDPLTFKELRKDLSIAQAYLNIKKKEYNPAIDPLEEAITLSNDRSEKARMSYIIAQIHQQEGRGDQALASFERALKYSPSYEMEFSSRLNVAQNAWINGQVTSEEALKTLAQMLKDSKNVEYKDQVFFAMAQINIKEKNIAGAIANLKSSLLSSAGNDAQSAETHLLLAQLYYDQEDYVQAKYSFDSTLMVLPKNDERFAKTEAFRDNLTDIAKNIEIIALQDSLLAIASMNEEEKKELAYQIKKEQEAKKIAAAAAASRNAVKTTSKSRSSGVAPSNFFAYDDKKIKKGKKDFEKRWGERSLEDDWRRSARKGSIGELSDEEQAEQISKELTQQDIDEIFKDVPQTPQQIKAAKTKIGNALFALGTLYKDRLERNDLAIVTLEDLSNRFPGNDKELEAWYFLYVMFNEANNDIKAQEYYTKITNRYANSLYAQALTDPDFKNKTEAERNRLNDYYDDTYVVFQQANYEQTHQRITDATKTFGKTNELQAKFALLDAMCMGNIKGKDEYIKQLKNIVAKFPDTDEQTRAKEILRLLGSKGVSGVRDEQSIASGGNFKVNEEQVHYFIVALKDNTVKLTDAKAQLSNYHRKYHQLDRLRISNIYLGADTSMPILVVRRYKDKNAAMRYYNGILKNEQDFLDSAINFEMFAVSQSNYRQILKLKSLEQYRSFFQENYLDSN